MNALNAMILNKTFYIFGSLTVVHKAL